MTPFEFSEPPVEAFPRLGTRLGVELFVKRDDVLPFPLAGNKVRKLFAEAVAHTWAEGDVLITNGAVDSNHCRTLALMAAKLGAHAHLVVHGDSADSAAVRLLLSLGADVDVVPTEDIAAVIADRRMRYENEGHTVRVIAGGAHTPAGVESYRDVGLAVLGQQRFDHVIVASGTGATQAGLHIAGVSTGTPVTGISVARDAERGVAAVREAVEWLDPARADFILFEDRFTDGGYGKASALTNDVVAMAWKHGLPVDATYTGKALRGLITMIEEGAIAHGDRVLFWHTGGLMNHLVTL